MVDKLLRGHDRFHGDNTEEERGFLESLARDGQSPGALFVGCSDSRVVPEILTASSPGELFVVRNVANVVPPFGHASVGVGAALEYAVAVLQVPHVIVCGHYGCGGVDAALHQRVAGLSDNWLRHVQDVRNKHSEALRACRSSEHRLQRLCELNVIEQVVNVCQTTVVDGAWERGAELAIHGWIYSIANGLLRDLGITVRHPEQCAPQYEQALARVSACAEIAA